MQHTSFAAILAASLISLPLAGCPGQAPTSSVPQASVSPTVRTAAAIDGDACEHLQHGPIVGLTASASASADAPLVSKPHSAFDLTLPGLGADPTYVRYSVSKAGDYVFYLDKAADLTVTSDANAAVSPKESATSAAGCPVAKTRHVFPLTVGTYMLKIGPTGSATVNFVAIAADDPGDEK